MSRTHLLAVVLAAASLVASSASFVAVAAPPARPEVDRLDTGLPADLPAADVLRLTEEAHGQLGEGKLVGGERLARIRDAHPAAMLAEDPHDYDALHYRLDVTPSRTANLISGTMTLDLEVVNPAIIVIDLYAGAGMTITATRVNGTPRTFTRVGELLYVPVCEGANCPAHPAGAVLQVAVDYSASPSLGFYYYARNSYTLAEPYDARFWFPCYDLPADKATLDVYATVPDTNTCYSNGVLVSVTPGAPGKNVYHWQETHPISTYLVAISVGKYWEYIQHAGALSILQAVFPEDSTKMKFDVANMPAMFPLFISKFGPYAFDKYGQVAVTPFGAGGMEHQSMTTINRTWVTGTRNFENSMAHELAHQWWGDKVTLVDFRNIWLNEGFASYGECIWQEGFYGAGAYDTYVATQMNSALASDNSFRYPLYDPPPANLFGNTIYKKGSVVLHMLRRVVGDAAFFAGMQLYGQRYQLANASTADFQDAMEETSGQPLAWFFDPWVYGQGLPTYNWGWVTAPGAPGQTRLGVQIRQVQTNAPYFQMPVELRVQRSVAADTTITITNHAMASESFVIDVNGTVTNVFFDPRNSIYKRIFLVAVDAPIVNPDAGPSIALAASPNPARGAARIVVSLATAATVALDVTIYDSAGRAVRAFRPARAAARTEMTWDLRDRGGARVAPGLYFVQARAGTSHEERPLVVIE